MKLIKRQIGKYQAGDKIKRAANEEAVRNNRSNRAIAKGMLNGMLSGDILPTLPNLWRMASAGFNGYFNRENENPLLQTGAPDILPGKMNNVIMMEEEAPTIYRLITLNPKLLKSLIGESKDYFGSIYRPFGGIARKIRTFLGNGDRNLLKEIEEWAIKHSNLVTREGSTISEMTIPKGYIEKSFPSKPSDYMLKGLNKPKPMSDLQWGDPEFEDFGGYIDRITSLYRNGGLIRKMQTAAGGPITNAIDPMLIDYIKAIENPNKVGWDGKVWRAPNLKGYDQNLRGYGIDIVTNKAARLLTKNRPGQWLTEQEADNLMRSHINYITDAANRHIRGFGQLSPERQAALLGMLYRGDSVNKSGINIMDPSDAAFFNAVHNYYNNRGLRERASNSAKFFSSRQPKLIRRRR